MSFMPGCFPGGAAAAGGGITSLTQVLSATSTASTITQPVGIQAGDLLVLLDMATSVGNPTSVTPTGWTTPSGGDLSDGGFDRQMISYKLADGSEGGVSITGMSGGINTQKALYVFRGDKPITSLTISTVNNQITSGDPAAQNVAASGGTAPLVVLGCYGAENSAVTPRTMTPAKDGEINGSTFAYLAYKIYNSAPADVTVDKDDDTSGSGGNMLQSLYIACS